MFLPGKEALLLIVDELRNRSMSLELTRRIDQQKKGILLLNHTSDHSMPLENDHFETNQAIHITERVTPSTYYTLTVCLFTI